MRARNYQEQITGRQGQAFLRNGVKFDGFDAQTGALLEAKGPGYANFLDEDGNWKAWFESSGGVRALEDQAKNQLKAAGGSPVIWHVAEENAANAIRDLVKDFGIKVVFTPPI